MLIPLKVDVPITRRPWVNYVLIATIVVVSLVGFFDDEFFCELAGIRVDWSGGLPDEVTYHLSTDELPMPVLALTSSFLHAGWIHLIGNMLFLWVFGNAINYKFGHLGYLALYLAAAMASGLAHYGFDGSPVVGASGAIYGVMGAFLVFFPRNNITIFWLIWVRPGISSLSSGWIVLFWMAWGTLFLALGTETDVALWGHIGGFVTGFTVAFICASTGLVKPTQDEETLLQVFGMRPGTASSKRRSGYR